jgi:hypothetical protein
LEGEAKMGPITTFRGRLEENDYRPEIADFLRSELGLFKAEPAARRPGRPPGRGGSAYALAVDWAFDLAQSPAVRPERVSKADHRHLAELVRLGGWSYRRETLPFGRYKPIPVTDADVIAFQKGARKDLAAAAAADPDGPTPIPEWSHLALARRRLALTPEQGKEIRRLLEPIESALQTWLGPDAKPAEPPPELVNALHALPGELATLLPDDGVGWVEAGLECFDRFRRRIVVKRCDGQGGKCGRLFRPDSKQKFCKPSCTHSGTTRRDVRGQRQLEERRRRAARKQRTSSRQRSTSTRGTRRAPSTTS